MKLNFWQMLGLVLLVIGIILFARQRMSTHDTVNTTTTAPAPATGQ